jgi:hypothetical protein
LLAVLFLGELPERPDFFGLFAHGVGGGSINRLYNE